MTSEKIPYLSGGIFFNLLIESTKQKINARTKLNGDKDLYSDTNLMGALVTLTIGDIYTPSGDTFKKNTSDYKRCKISKSTFLDFDNTVKLSLFHDSVISKDPAVHQHMKNLVDNFLSEARHQWLVRALIETIVEDSTIPIDTGFDVGGEKVIKKEQLNEVAQINIDYFLANVWDYILQNKKDNTLGRSTFEIWYKQYSKNGVWSFCNESLGSTITQPITITRFEMPNNNCEENFSQNSSVNTDSDTNCSSSEDTADIPTVEAEVIDDKSDDKSKRESKCVNQIFSNSKVINQYAEKIFNAEVLNYHE